MSAEDAIRRDHARGVVVLLAANGPVDVRPAPSPYRVASTRPDSRRFTATPEQYHASATLHACHVAGLTEEQVIAKLWEENAWLRAQVERLLLSRAPPMIAMVPT